MTALREAAQAVMDAADLLADENEMPLWDWLPIELTDRLTILRAALDAIPEAERRCSDCGFTAVEIGDMHINAQIAGSEWDPRVKGEPGVSRR